MSGHNKWSKIKHKKGAADAEKSRIFSKYSKLISMEAKLCDGDTSSPALRAVIEKAKKENMPNANIERAVKKASESAATINEAVFEFYGPGGVGIIVVAMTDNNNRTSSEIRSIVSKSGYTLGTLGSVMWSFTRDPTSREFTPNTKLDISMSDRETLMRIIETLEEHDDVVNIFTNAE